MHLHAILELQVSLLVFLLKNDKVFISLFLAKDAKMGLVETRLAIIPGGGKLKVYINF